MRIGEITKITGLSKDTIRFYEKKKLIDVPRRREEWNNYKEYTDSHIQQLLLIKKCKGWGFTLNEIGDILTKVETGEASCDVLAILAQQKLAEIEERIQELESMRDFLSNRIALTQTQCKLTPAVGLNGNCQLVF